jgi:hypothetical protein
MANGEGASVARDLLEQHLHDIGKTGRFPGHEGGVLFTDRVEARRAGGLARGAPLFLALRAQARHRGVVGQELARASEEPCHGLGRPAGGRDEHGRVCPGKGAAHVLGAHPPLRGERVEVLLSLGMASEL